MFCSFTILLVLRFRLSKAWKEEQLKIKISIMFFCRYYPTDYEVQADNEVQKYANEVSDKGSKPGGAKVQVNQ
jgi:hypothetical protein